MVVSLRRMTFPTVIGGGSGALSADGAILGARIRTLDPSRPAATAVAWRDGVMTAVGSDDEVRSSWIRARA